MTTNSTSNAPPPLQKNMPQRDSSAARPKKGKTPPAPSKLRRYIAPFAPLALALAINTAKSPRAPSPTGEGFDPECALPFAGVRNPLFDDQCGIAGGSTDLAKQEESKAKNNFCAPTQSPRAMTYGELISLQSQSTKIARNLRDRTPVRNLGEGEYVSYVAFIKDAHYSDVSAGEAVNCGIPGRGTNDIHIVLLKDLGDDECMSTTAEISPHYRPPDWTAKNLMNASVGHPVRLQGQLFFDGSHKPCSGTSRPNPKRASVWEVHPVYSIDICQQTTIDECQKSTAAWKPLSDQLKSDHE